MGRRGRHGWGSCRPGNGNPAKSTWITTLLQNQNHEFELHRFWRTIGGKFFDSFFSFSFFRLTFTNNRANFPHLDQSNAVASATIMLGGQQEMQRFGTLKSKRLRKQHRKWTELNLISKELVSPSWLLKQDDGEAEKTTIFAVCVHLSQFKLKKRQKRIDSEGNEVSFVKLLHFPKKKCQQKEIETEMSTTTTEAEDIANVRQEMKCQMTITITCPE